jgi:hypothetical protein
VCSRRRHHRGLVIIAADIAAADIAAADIARLGGVRGDGAGAAWRVACSSWAAHRDAVASRSGSVATHSGACAIMACPPECAPTMPFNHLLDMITVMR